MEPRELTEHEAESEFDEFLSNAYDTINVCGLEMNPGKVLKECDEIAYREALNN